MGEGTIAGWLSERMRSPHYKSVSLAVLLGFAANACSAIWHLITNCQMFKDANQSQWRPPDPRERDAVGYSGIRVSARGSH